jgi:hypothetical protein
LWEEYRWYYVGTQNLSEKYDRKEEDFPFPKMSNITVQNLGRGWQRNATRFIEASNGDKCCVLANTWIDKKQLGFRLSGKVVKQKGNTTKRYVKGQRVRKDISCPQVQQDYAMYFNGVDRNDRDSADFTTSLKTNRWYMRYYFYLLDRVVHAMYRIVTDIAVNEPRDEWLKYRAVEGRYTFQIDLAMNMIEWGIKCDWPYPWENNSKPHWTRKMAPIPCNCTRCFFCSTGKTTGVMSVPSPTGVSIRSVRNGCDQFPEKIVRDNGKVRTDYCRPCMYKYKQLFPKRTSRERVKMCVQTTFGCNGCGTYVCKECYKTYNHNFIGNESHPYYQT